MSKKVKVIRNLKELADENGIIEVVYRKANKRFREFVKYAVAKEPTNSDIYNLVNNVALKMNKLDLNMDKIGKITNASKALSTFNAILGVANLCTTVAGFVIINKNLNKISSSVQEVLDTVKNIHDINVNYKFQEVISEYKNMLDKKRYGERLSEEEYRKLIDFENNVLSMLINGLLLDTNNNRLDILYAILSLASMMSVTICDFDEIYYYNHKDSIKDGNYFHSSRGDWLNTLDRVIDTKVLEKVQDVCFLDENLNQHDTDVFVEVFEEKIISLKQDIVDTNALLLVNKDNESYRDNVNNIDKDILAYINSEISNQQYSEELENNVSTYLKELQLAQ